MQARNKVPVVNRYACRPRIRKADGMGIGQLFAVIFGFLITSALIFLFGMWVGRDVAERDLASEERVVRAPIRLQPTAIPEAKPPEVDATFYEQLKEKAVQRMQQTAAAASPTAARPVAVAATPTREPVRVVERTHAPTPEPRPKRNEVTKREEWADAGWTVQVNATTNSQQAADLVRKLKAKGYDAYIVESPMHGQPWYRVRVGRLSNREKAKELEAPLRSDGQENAFVTPQ